MTELGRTSDLDRFPSHLIELFRCPRCNAEGVSDESGVVCEAGHRFEYTDGVLDASVETDETTRRTLKSFGYEWSTFDRIQQEDEAFWRRYFADVPLDDLRGHDGLDAGCGKGRFAYFTAPYLRSVVALDGSDAVDAAARNLAGFDNVGVVRASLTAIPFKGGSFGFIWCLGVLHHLADPEAGFDALVSRLRPGGRLLVYVYSRATGQRARSIGLTLATLVRKVTVHLPHPLLRFLSGPIAGILYSVVVFPGWLGGRLGVAALENLPLQTYRGRPLRSLWLDTFDRLSAPLERRYVWSDIEPWFRGAGMVVESVREDAGLIVLARKKADSEETA